MNNAFIYLFIGILLGLITIALIVWMSSQVGINTKSNALDKNDHIMQSYKIEYNSIAQKINESSELGITYSSDNPWSFRSCFDSYTTD